MAGADSANEPASTRYVLTEQEVKLMRLIAIEGLSNLQIMHKLAIAESEFQKLRRSVRRNALSRPRLRIEFACFYVEMGLDISPLAGRDAQWKRLSEAQKKLAMLLVSGMTTSAAGDWFDCSQSQISKQAKKICRVLDIRSYVQLPALLAGLSFAP